MSFLSTMPDEWWLSKDMDFVVAEFAGPPFDQIKAKCPQWVKQAEDGYVYLEVQGVRLSFPQMGVTFLPDDAFETSVLIDVETDGTRFQCAVLNPVLLFREKWNLVDKNRGKPNDYLHKGLARLYCVYHIGVLARQYATNPSPSTLQRLQKQVLLTYDKASQVMSDPLLINSLKEIAKDFPDFREALATICKVEI